MAVPERKERVPVLRHCISDGGYKECYNVRQGERKKAAVNNMQWKLLVAEKR